MPAKRKMMNNSFVLLLLFLLHEIICGENIDDILKNGIDSHVYPGVTAMAGRGGAGKSEILYSKAFGTYEYLDEYPDSPNVTLSSIYDLASVTKVLGTTSAIALLYQNGYLSLEVKVGEILDETIYSKTGQKENVTILNCLLHNAGYKPDPVPAYYESSFGCPNGFQNEDFSCLSQIYDSLLHENLVTLPGEAYVYSDLSFITLQMVVGKLAFQHSLISISSLRSECYSSLLDSFFSITQINKGLLYVCYFEAFIRKEIFQEDSRWLETITFLPSSSLASSAIPTMDTSYTKEIRQGNVSDSNCYAMGGICGHAGLFTSINDIRKMLQRFLLLTSSSSLDDARATVDPFPGWLNTTTMKLFTKEYNSNQSSRALGWTINDPNVRHCFLLSLWFLFLSVCSFLCRRCQIMVILNLVVTLVLPHLCISVILEHVSVLIQ
jgi:CubicO group peptidase (beta-lactamase class C family)